MKYPVDAAIAEGNGYTIVENASLEARNTFHVPARAKLLIDIRKREALSELFVDLRQFENFRMQHDRQPGIPQSLEQFLALAKGIAQQYRDFVVIQCLPAELQHTVEDFSRWWKVIDGASVSSFHDQNVRGPRLAQFGRQALAQFEVAGVKQRGSRRFDPGHGAAKNVPGGQQGNLIRKTICREGSGLAEGQHLFQSLTAEPGLHQS